MSELKNKIMGLKEQIPLTDTRLAPVRDMLASAEVSVNGATDKPQAISETVGHVAMLLAVERILEPERRKQEIEEFKAIVLAAVESHGKACPMRGPVTGKAAVIYPFRWPLAAVLCVAMLVMGSERVYNLFAKGRDAASCAQFTPNE